MGLSKSWEGRGQLVVDTKEKTLEGTAYEENKGRK